MRHTQGVNVSGRVGQVFRVGGRTGIYARLAIAFLEVSHEVTVSSQAGDAPGGLGRCLDGNVDIERVHIGGHLIFEKDFRELGGEKRCGGEIGVF